MGHVARMIEMRNSYKILVEKLGARRPLQTPEHDIKINRKVVDWLQLAQYTACWRDVWIMVIKIRYP
jgi:hypothetical protein